MVLNKRSPTQVASPVLGEVNVETKSGNDRKNSGTDYSCSEFHGGFNGAKTGFVSPNTVREIFVYKERENRET
jgi:hypothetical protein